MSVKTYTGSQLTSYETDDYYESHGTHTTGSMAGGTYGNSTFYGMAPNADIVIGCGDSDFSSHGRCHGAYSQIRQGA